MVPIPHLPIRYLRTGDRLVVGDEFLMLKGVTVVLVDLGANTIYSVTGQHRVSIERKGLRTYSGKGLLHHKPASFPDPRAAVEQIGRMLRDRAWLKLAMYYDLSGTEVDLAKLISGAFFLHAEALRVGHPAVDNRIKEPFSPQFSYHSHRGTAGDEIVVIVSFSVDEGMGMVREGLDAFPMRKTENGYRLIPKSKSGPETDSVPILDPGPGIGPLK
jgi:hypothetical protein